MREQNFTNHRRFLPLWHIFTAGAILIVLTYSIVRLFQTSKENLYSDAMHVLVALILVSFFAFARLFALRAQDRAIRAEENFRHFVLTGKPFDSRLGMAQIIALRFASDPELAGLAKKAAEENMNSKEIKGSIKNWRPDYHRA